CSRQGACSMTTTTESPQGRQIAPARRGIRWGEYAPYIALALVILIGALINPNFLGANNILNVVTRTAFIAIIAVGATFVISSGGLDLSVGSMMAFVTGVMI